MGCFRVQYTALILSIGVINGESWEESCLNPNTEEQCSGNGICREEYDEGGTYNQCRCFSSEYRPPWFGPDEWSKVSNQYRGLSVGILMPKNAIFKCWKLAEIVDCKL